MHMQLEISEIFGFYLDLFLQKYQEGIQFSMLFICFYNVGVFIVSYQKNRQSLTYKSRVNVSKMS